MEKSFLCLMSAILLTFAATGRADLFYSNNTGVTDWNTDAGVLGGLNQTINVSENELITGISFDLNGLTHSWVGDLSVELIAPDSTSMIIVGQLMGGGFFGDSSDWSGNYSFADGGASLWTELVARGEFEAVTPGVYGAADNIGGIESPNSFSATFGGLTTQGTWTVNFQSTAVPEPSVFGLLSLGGLALGLVRRRRQ